jgi:hypothetical protein
MREGRVQAEVQAIVVCSQAARDPSFQTETVIAPFHNRRERHLR